MIRDVHLGSGPRIWILFFYPSWILDLGVKKAPDPGSGAFLTPGPGIRNRFFPDPRSRILDPNPIFFRAWRQIFG
jgi:hypothetical protein